MITVKIFEHAVNIKGHAGFAGLGQDIVCAAVSTLFYTLAEHLSRTTETEDDIGPGYAYLRWDGDAVEAVEMFKTGLEMIEAEHPECLRIEDTSSASLRSAPSPQGEGLRGEGMKQEDKREWMYYLD